MKDEAFARAAVIRASLEVWVCGIFGVLPVLGLVPGLYAIVRWLRVRAAHRDQWNPAAAYLNGGAALALIGLLCSGVVMAAIGVALINSNAL